MTHRVESAVYVHPAAICESQTVGENTRVWAFAHVMDGAVVGCRCNIGGHAYIEAGARIGDEVTIKNQVMIWDGVTIEDNVFVGPGVIFTNDRYPRSRYLSEASSRYGHVENWRRPTLVRRGAVLGAGAKILCGVTIGRFATVAMGAVVTRDVPDHRLVAGHPARVVGWVCPCGLPLTDVHSCRGCGRSFRIVDDQLTDRD